MFGTGSLTFLSLALFAFFVCVFLTRCISSNTPTLSQLFHNPLVPPRLPSLWIFFFFCTQMSAQASVPVRWQQQGMNEEMDGGMEWPRRKQRVRDRELKGARMENAGKPSGGQSEWSPHSSPPFVCPGLCSFLSIVHLLPFFPLSLQSFLWALLDLLGCLWLLILITCSTEGLCGCVWQCVCASVWLWLVVMRVT